MENFFLHFQNQINQEDYISLTDIARYVNPEEPKVPIQTWMRNKDVIE